MLSQQCSAVALGMAAEKKPRNLRKRKAGTDAGEQSADEDDTSLG